MFPEVYKWTLGWIGVNIFNSLVGCALFVRESTIAYFVDAADQNSLRKPSKLYAFLFAYKIGPP